MRNKFRMFWLGLLSAVMMGMSAQERERTWTEWTKADAEKILNNSPWAQTQVETDMYTNGGTIIASSQNVRIRLVSAKPIRQALLRIMELNRSRYSTDEIAKAREFANFKYDRTIVVGLRSEGRSPGSGDYEFFPDGMPPDFMRTYFKNVYLGIKGKQIFVQEYQRPTQDGLGVKFIFPRLVDGRPVIDAEAGEVLFHAELGKLIINRSFKIRDFLYAGVLEY